MLLVSQHGSRRILLANPTDEPREVSLDFAGLLGGGAILKPIGNGAAIPIQKFHAKVKLEAYGTAAFAY
jgi:hypothetical protein